MNFFNKKIIFTSRSSGGSGINMLATDITSNGLLATIPDGCIIDHIVFNETSGASVTVDIGTTAGDDDVLAAEVCPASETHIATLGTIFSVSSTQQIFISSAAWTTASLDVYILLRKI